MTAFFGIDKISLRIFCESNTIAFQLGNDIRRGLNHDIHRLSTVLIMTGSDRILKKAFIIRWILQYTYTALCQNESLSSKVVLQIKSTFLSLGACKAAKSPLSACSYDQNICLNHIHTLAISNIASMDFLA